MTSSGISTDSVEDQSAPHQPRLTDAPGRRSTVKTAQLPETLRYRVKRFLLGPPLVNDQLQGQRLGKPTALAVLSSDVMSSSAYASEEILRILVPIAERVAFSFVTPITGAILAVVTICYRDVVRSYPKAGGSYVGPRSCSFGQGCAITAFPVYCRAAACEETDDSGTPSPSREDEDRTTEKMRERITHEEVDRIEPCRTGGRGRVDRVGPALPRR
jgi:hypothetical protein